ncbi:MAG: DUF1028 domain-containing protein [Desulfurococcales archaeon]|nr:DUF1028 domain-containing protein [Desulfurococcales archaeon]
MTLRDRGLSMRVSTFSIVGFDPETGDLGVAVASKFIAVGAIVPWARAGVGAIATQALANVSYGPRGLELLSKGYDAREVLKKLVAGDPQREERQVGIVDSKGNAAAFTGSKCYQYAGHIIGEGYTVQGNILAGPEVLEEMAKAYETTQGELVDKLLASLEAGDRAGGDKRGKQSAAIVVVREGGGYGGYTDRYVDLRVDDHHEPVRELKRIFRIWELTLLTREKPDDTVLKHEVAEQVQEALRRLGYYDGKITGKWDQETEKAFTDWALINNFENKLRNDDYIWGTVYRFLIESSKGRI